MWVTAGSRLGVYEITGPIGTGGMGEVYGGRDTTLDRDEREILPQCLAATRSAGSSRTRGETP